MNENEERVEDAKRLARLSDKERDAEKELYCREDWKKGLKGLILGDDD